MHDASDMELQKTPSFDVNRPQEPRGRGVWIAAGVGVAALVVALYLLLVPRDAPDSSAATEATPVGEPAGEPAAAAVPAAGTDAPIDLPPLDETDAIVRPLVRALSSHPRVAAWLAGDELIRNFTVVVDNIASGHSPARHLAVLRPEESFQAIDQDGELIVDPRSYDRYAPIAAAVESIDAQAAARLYTALKPRIEDAARELGQTQPFDRVLARAIRVLLDTPAIDGDVRLNPAGAVYQFESPAVEDLNAAQKQLLRMGPSNVRIIQARLREIAAALGI